MEFGAFAPLSGCGLSASKYFYVWIYSFNPKARRSTGEATLGNVLSARSRALGKRLLTQQCWCWGWDVRYAEGNLLLRYGFDRQRPPQNESGATTYSLRLLPDRFIALWGFGMWYGDARGAIYIGRFNFEAKYFPQSQLPVSVWTPPQIEALHQEMSTRMDVSQWRLICELLQDALRWVGDYEQWLLANSGLEYRRNCLEAWSQKFVPPEQMVPAWQQLSRVIKKRRQVQTV